MKRIAVVLSGCGHLDGAEITESVSTLIALTEAGAAYKIFAPDQDFPVADRNGQPTGQSRNVLAEAARIARGQIQPLTALHAKDFDGLAMPGGFGAAKNLSNWAEKGAACTVNPEIERILNEFYMAEKPIAAICIAPAVIARVLGAEGVTLTVGRDAATVAEIRKTGATHVDCAVDDYVTDRDRRIVTTPAYMYEEASPFAVYTGIRKAIREAVEMA